MGHKLFTLWALVCFSIPLCTSLDQASFYGGSFITIPLKEAKSSTEIHFKFRTRLPNALLLLVAGTTDHCILRLDGGRIKLNINLGGGESELITQPNLSFNDLKWHQVSVVRKEANISIVVDNTHTYRKKLPGKFFELNIHHGLFLGGTGNFTELFFGHVDNFRGCMAEVMYNGLWVLEQARHRQSHALVYGVTWNCAAEFEAKANKSISFVEDGAFIALTSSSLYSLKLQMELRTTSLHCVLIYNAGSPAKPDLFALELWNGKVRVTLKHSNKIIDLVGDDFVADGHWHKVFLRITTTLLELKINSSQKNVKLPRGHVVEFSQVFYIGGIELSKRSRAMTKGLKTADSSFKGCLRHMIVGDQPKGLPDVHVSEGILPGCVWQYPCLKDPCKEGLCVQQGLDAYQCRCHKQDNCTIYNFPDKVFSRGTLANDLQLLTLEPLKVLEGQNVLITTANLHIILDYPKYGIKDFGIKFYIVEAPTHGSINIEVWPHEKNTFTLADIARDKIHYVHDGSETTFDQIMLELELSTSDSFILPAYLQGRFQFSLAVNITPVNDPPTLHIPTTSVFRIAQETRKILPADLLKISDPDSLEEKIVINVVNVGEGHLELSRKTGSPISSFSKQDLENGNIYYAHHGTRNNETYISFQVSDGIESSSIAKLRVSTFPQFWRLQNNTGLVLMHQTFAVITPSNLSFVSNVENSTDNANFNIIREPQYGVIEIEKEEGLWDRSPLFTSEDLRQRRVRYRHISSRPEFDEFQFRTSLNTSMLFTFRMTFAKCNLVQVNLKTLQLNSSWEESLKVEQLLYQTEPVPSPATSINYIIMESPQYGFFFSAVSKYRLRLHDSFTQEDISFGNIKYKLHRKSYSQVLDSAMFTVTTPACKNVTANFTIIYTPSRENLSKVDVVLRRLQVEEGGRGSIGTTHLDINTDIASELLFNVTQGPSHGMLQVIKNGNIRNKTTFFTLTELHGNQLYYLHDDSENGHDSFKFMALSREEENFQYVDTFHIDIVLKNDNSPVRVVDKVFHVVVGGQRLLTGQDLRFEDADLNTSPKDIVYNCRELPNGEIYNAKRPSQKLEEFTQADLNEGHVLFKHKGPEYGKVRLWVTDGQFYVNGILEVQASAPFIRIMTNKKLIVQQAKMGIFTPQHIAYVTNLFATDQDVVYEIITKPNYGKIIRTDNLQEITKFTQADINEGLISYKNNLSTASADEVGLRVRCRDAINIAQLGIWMLPAIYWEPLQVKMSRNLMVEESTSALIDSSILEVFQSQVPATSITYHIADYPENGYIGILSASPGAQEDSSNINSFTQALVNENRVIYVQSLANRTDDKITFNVTNGIVWLYGLVLGIQIIPERLYLGSNVLNVHEGGTTVLSSVHLYILTEYYKSKVTDYVILEQPKHGCLQVHKRCTKLHGFSHKELTAGVVHYAHDGSENLVDEITLVAVAGQKRSFPLTINVEVLAVNDQKPKLVNNTGLTMWEGGVAVITNCMLAATDADRPKEMLRFQVSGCWWGNISLINDADTSLQFFTQELINKHLVVFRHQNGSEAKFTFNVSDGLHSTKEYTFSIKTKPVQLSIGQRPLHIFPLQRKYITASHLTVSISDPDREVQFEVITPPALGRLMMESDSPGSYKVVHSFTKHDLSNSRLFYEHTHPFADLYANDSFIFNVRAHLAKPLLNKKMAIYISVSSGGLDAYVSIPKIQLDEGGLTNIPLNLSGVVSFLENHAGLRSPIIHASALKPQHGQIFLYQNQTNILTFKQPQLESGQVYYQHDHSDSLGDNLQFSLYLLPGYIMLCNITIPVTINPINDQPFKLVTPAPHLVVVQGENHTITKKELSTEDVDTPPPELIYDIISGPSEGWLVLLPNREPISRFTQADIDDGNLVYVHNGSKLTDIFNFRVWDNGKFSRPDYSVFNIRVIPINVTVEPGFPVYLQQGSNVVLLSTKQFIVNTNADRQKFLYVVKEGPKHGVIYVNDNQSGEFYQSELENENVMYMQTDMTTANDSFRIFAGIVFSNTSIGYEVEVVVKVQPLMQLGNLTVIAGEMNRINLQVLDAAPLAKLTNSNPRYTVLQSPSYGQVRKIIRSSGERRNVLDAQVTSFSHEEVQSGLIYVVVSDIEVGWGGLEDKLIFVLAASIFQPAIGELNIVVRSPLHNDVDSTLAGPNDPAGHEGGMHYASPNMTRDYFLIVSMVTGVIILGVAVIIIIKCRTFEPEELNKEEQCLQPIPLPRPPDRLMMSSSPTLKHTQDGFASTVPATLPHCKVTPLSRTELDTHARYPYGVDEHSDDWSSCEASDPASQSRNNIMLRRNQYWV